VWVVARSAVTINAVLGEAKPTAFLPATDLDRACAFYRDRLGLTLIEQTPFACVFQLVETTLRVTAVESFSAQPFTVFGWSVKDLRSTVAEMSARAEIEFLRYDGMDQDEAGIWLAPSGVRVAWFKDSEGNTLSLNDQPV